MGVVFSATDIKSRTVAGAMLTEHTTRLNYLGVSYFARMVLVKRDNRSFSIGSPVTLGISWATLNDSYSYSMISSVAPPVGTTGSGSKKPHVALELPIVLDHNIGAGSSPGNKKSFGAYFGAGAAYTYTSISLSDGSNRKVDSYDPLVRAGIRLGAHQPFTFGLSYKWNKQIGLQILKDF